MPYRWAAGGWRSHIDKATGIGIMAGDGLAILDLDSPRARERFEGALPYLTDTLRCETPRGVHYYYRTQISISTRRYPEADLLGDGAYALAYAEDRELVIDREMITLTADDLAAIDRVLGSPGGPAAPPAPTPADPSGGVTDLVSRYRMLAGNGSRNVALYRTLAGQRPTIDELARLEVAFVNDGRDGIIETKREREREARLTIASALRARRPVSNHRTLYDGTRQWLLTNYRFAGTRLAELIDALLTAGYESRPISRRQIMAVCQERGIGIRTFDHLQTHAPELVAKFFTVAAPPSGHPPADAGVNTSHSEYEPTVFTSRKKSSLFVCVPARLAAQRTDTLRHGAWSSPLQLTERAHPRTYREAFYQAHLARRPEQAHRQAWLAAMLGIGARTVRNYNDSLGIVRIDAYQTWHIAAFELDEDMGRAWCIQTPERTYPCTKALQQQLIHNRLARIRHLAGQYLRTPAMIASETISSEPVQRASKRASHGAVATIRQVIESHDGPTQQMISVSVDASASHRVSDWQPDPWSGIGRESYVSYTARDGSLVVTTASRANQRQRTASIQRLLPGISQRNAKQLIKKYGYEAVRSVITEVAGYRNTRNRVGLVISKLRKLGATS
jgi:hypothetical protein